MKKQRSARRDDAIDEVRTIYWFQCLGEHVGSFRPRTVQRAIAPAPEKDALGGAIKNNKFLGYSKGAHVPNAALVQRAAQMVPHAAYVLDHVIWDILRAQSPVEKQVRAWVRLLDPDIQKALLRPGYEIGESDRTLDMLERRFSLDSLAALTILFRMSHEQEQAQAADNQPLAFRPWLFACAIFRTLMLVQPDFITDELSTKIFQLFVQRVFSRVVSFWRARMVLEDYDFPKMAAQFHETAASYGIYTDCPPLSRDVRGQVVELIHIPLAPVGRA